MISIEVALNVYSSGKCTTFDADNHEVKTFNEED